MRENPLVPVAIPTWLCAIAVHAVGPLGTLVSVMTGLIALMVPERRVRLYGAVVIGLGLVVAIPSVGAHERSVALDSLASSDTAALLDANVRVESDPELIAHARAADRWFVRAVPLEGTVRIGHTPVTLPDGTRYILTFSDSAATKGQARKEAGHSGAEVRVRGSFERRGSTIFVTVASVSPRPPGNNASNRTFHNGAREFFRHRFVKATETLPSEEAALVQGFVLGDASGLSTDTEEAMRTSGLTHLVAASGSNIALAYAFVVMPLLYTGARRKTRVVVGSVAIALYVWLVGPEPSLVRAATMAIPLLIARFVGFRTPPLNALAGAVLVWSCAQPALASSVGFVLSVVATAAIIVGAPRCAEIIREWSGDRVGEIGALAVAVPLVAQAACTPILVLLCPEISVWSVAANMLAELVVAPATLVGFAGVILAILWPPAALPCVWVSGGGAHVLIGIARGAETLPGAHIPVAPGARGAIFATAAVIAACIVLWLRHESVFRWAVAGGAVLALAVWGLRGPLNSGPNGWHVALCDVGQGDALLLRGDDAPQAPVVLIDSGPEPQALADCLDTLKVQSVDLLIATHPHADHTGGLPALVGGRYPRRVWACPLDNETETQFPHAEVQYPVQGHEARVGDLGVKVLWPRSGEEATRMGSLENGGEESGLNDCSIAVAASIPGVDGGPGTTLAALGDLEPKVQASLAKGGVDPATIVKVAHHGSRRQSPDLYGKLNPRIALIGVGANSFGHPHRDTRDMLEGRGSRILRSDQCGLTTLTVRNPREIEVRTACSS